MPDQYECRIPLELVDRLHRVVVERRTQLTAYSAQFEGDEAVISVKFKDKLALMVAITTALNSADRSPQFSVSPPARPATRRTLPRGMPLAFRTVEALLTKDAREAIVGDLEERIDAMVREKSPRWLLWGTLWTRVVWSMLSVYSGGILDRAEKIIGAIRFFRGS